MAIPRTVMAILLLTLPPLCAQAERLLSSSDGNFELQGNVEQGAPVTLRFRMKSGLGYRLLLSGPAAGRLDDPGRRTGVLAAPAVKVAGRTVAFKLTANGPQLHLDLGGQPVWDYVEKEAGVTSAGAVRLTGRVRDVVFTAMPPTPASFSERYGPAVGERAPLIAALDQTGKQRDFASLRGPKGLWVLFFRSADW